MPNEQQLALLSQLIPNITRQATGLVRQAATGQFAQKLGQVPSTQAARQQLAGANVDLVNLQDPRVQMAAQNVQAQEKQRMRQAVLDGGVRVANQFYNDIVEAHPVLKRYISRPTDDLASSKGALQNWFEYAANITGRVVSGEFAFEREEEKTLRKGIAPGRQPTRFVSTLNNIIGRLTMLKSKKRLKDFTAENVQQWNDLVEQGRSLPEVRSGKVAFPFQPVKKPRSKIDRGIGFLEKKIGVNLPFGLSKEELTVEDESFWEDFEE